MAFIRKFSVQKLNSLKNEKLFSLKLQFDKNVFPAIRNNVIDFYYRGGKLFEYRSNEFRTHFKYAILQKQIKQPYIKPSSSFQVPLSSNFLQDYKRIKDNCKNYSGIESSGISELYQKYSYLNLSEEIVVLDVEVSFESLTEKKQDRIDLLLFNKSLQSLKFVEAKHFTNPELWAKKGKKPKVISTQLPKYKAQIASKRNDIIMQYQNYVQIINSLFNTNLPLPITVEDEVILFIFGYDSDQIKGGSRLVKLILNDPAFSGIYYYSAGSSKNTNMNSLWKGKRL